MLAFRLRTCLSLVLVTASADACRPPQEAAHTGAYVENGVLWAFGSVELANLETPGAVMISRVTAVQSVNTPASTTYQFYGAALATTGGTGRRDLAYVDLHPAENRVLAYAYELYYQPRACSVDQVDVFAILKKAGRSYGGLRTVLLGTVNFQNGGTLAAMALAPGLKLSQIADGVFTGQWALHYPDVQTVVLHPWAGLCPKGVSQMPGQIPSQNPGQFASCRPLPPQSDLCEGDPTKDGCKWMPPVQQQPGQQPGVVTTPVSPPVEPAKAVTNLTTISAALGVYTMEATTQEAKIVFISARQAAAGGGADAQACASLFYAVARTIDRQVNTACTVKPAPATAQGGKLTCALTVSFDQPQTFLERACDISATFRGDAAGDEVQHIQVLKK